MITISGMGQKDVSSQLSNPKYHYSLEITERAVARNDMILQKYYIKKFYGNIVPDSMQMLNPELIYFIDYENGNPNYEQIEFSPTPKELDSIFILTKNLFHLDSLLGTKKDYLVYYDGTYASIKLQLDNYYTRMWIFIGLDEESVFRDRYFILKEYLRKLKKLPTTSG
jgi:hypothetical protein